MLTQKEKDKIIEDIYEHAIKLTRTLVPEDYSEILPELSIRLCVAGLVNVRPKFRDEFLEAILEDIKRNLNNLDKIRNK
jgi:hypothetical protein